MRERFSRCVYLKKLFNTPPKCLQDLCEYPISNWDNWGPRTIFESNQICFIFVSMAECTVQV